MQAGSKMVQGSAEMVAAVFANGSSSASDREAAYAMIEGAVKAAAHALV